MVRFRIVGRREEPANVQVAAAPGLTPTVQQITRAFLLVQAVDSEGNPFQNTMEGASMGLGVTIAVPVTSLADVSDMVTGEVYQLTPAL